MDEIKSGTPANIKELIKKADCKTSWKTRIEAIEELKKWDCEQSREIIGKLAVHDKVYKVMKEAFKVAEAMGIRKNGNLVKLGKKDIGYETADFTKNFLRVKREYKREEFDMKIFKEKFLAVNPEMYDVMLYENGDKFDSWIKTMYESLRNVRKAHIF